MPLSPDNVRQYRSEYHPADDVSPVGGARTNILISGNSPGEVIPDGSLVVSDSPVTVYYKTFLANDHSTLSLIAPRFYVENALDDMNSIDKIRIQNSPADAGKSVKLIGLSGGVVVHETVVLSNAPVVSNTSFGSLFRAELIYLGASVGASSEIQIYADASNVLLGVIPAGVRSATSEVAVGLSSTLDDAVTSPNRRTPPTGVTFSRPNTAAEAVELGFDIPAGSAIGVWYRYTFAGNTPPPVFPGVHVSLRVIGLSL